MAATAQFAKLSISAKNEYLFQHGINFSARVAKARLWRLLANAGKNWL